MATSPIYCWAEPDNTDLVKNGALAIRTLGNAIDTTMGTMVAKTIIDAKGDLIAGSAADTALRLAVGSNGETLVADSSTSTGLRYQSNFAAGKNKIINGDFGVWQRGTSFSNPSSGAYTADRYFLQHDGTGATRTISQQTFTPGTAPVAGYEGTYYFRYAISAAGTGNTYNVIKQAIEDVRVYAGQTVTMSVWLKADSARSVVLNLNQYFGSGGSSEVVGASTTASVTTSWQRFTYTATLGSMSGKTIGTGSYLTFTLQLPTNTTQTIEIWGAQVEASNTATAFQTATGTLQGELAACQRYYWRNTGSNNGQPTLSSIGWCFSTTQAVVQIQSPVPMRVNPTAVDFAELQLYRIDNAGQPAISGLGINNVTPLITEVIATANSLAANAPVVIRGDGSGIPYIGLSAEL